MDFAIINYYNNYDEEVRLFRNNTHKIEWITTMHYFKRLIPTLLDDEVKKKEQ